MGPAPRFSAARLALFYAAFFGVVGVQLPFWPVWLQARGQTGAQIGVLLAAGMWVRAFSNPLFAASADRRWRLRSLVRSLACAGCAAFALFAFADGFPALLAVSVLYGVSISAVLPLGETLAVRVAEASGIAYGRLRLWGSLGFIVAAVGAGRVVDRLSADEIFAIILSALALLSLVSFGLPDVRARHVDVARRPVRELIRLPGFVAFLITATLIQGSHGAYYGFATLHWQAAGIDRTTIGLLWAEGVVAEIVLFVFSARLSRALRPTGLLVCGAVAGVVRWTVLATTTDPIALVAVQWLHAFTFGATHLGAILFVARALPGRYAATGQALYAGVANGAGMGAALLLSGFVYERGGSVVWFVMLGWSALGLLGAVVLNRRRPTSSSSPASAPPSGPAAVSACRPRTRGSR